MRTLIMCANFSDTLINFEKKSLNCFYNFKSILTYDLTTILNVLINLKKVDSFAVFAKIILYITIFFKEKKI